MALESGTFIDSLNASNPTSTDIVSQADDHLRLIKSTIEATFPNINAAVTATPAALNAATSFDMPSGSIIVFAGPSSPTGFLFCDGSAVSRSTYADLFAIISTTYGVGDEKLSRETGMSISKAKKLLDAYWERNWSVKQFAEDQKIRTIGDDMWIQNPVSKFWHSLRYEKDAFSTINQSTGSYCFDKWVAFYRSKRSNIIGQFHDESINLIREGEEKEHTEILKWAVQKLNEQLKLNVELGIDVQYGNNYAEVH